MPKPKLLAISLSLIMLQSCSNAQKTEEKIDYSKLDPNSKFKQHWDKQHSDGGALEPRRPTLTDKQIAELAEKSTVVIDIPVPDTNKAVHATGFVVAPSIIATNHHVIANGIKNGIARIKYLNAPEPILCVLSKIVADDPVHDVALLELKTGSLSGEAKPLDAPALPLANPFDSLHKGDKVFLTGNPGRYNLTFSQGEISAFRSWDQIHEMEAGKRSSLDSPDNGDVIQYDAATSAGSSGSAVLNDRGEIIGVHMSGEVENAKENLNCATRVKFLRSLMVQAGLLTQNLASH